MGVPGPAERWLEADPPTKVEGGVAFPAAAYAYAPDATKPSTWKLRLWETPADKETAKQVGMALAALSPGGFRGQKVQVPAAALPAVKRKIFAAWKKVHPDDTAVPSALRGAEAMPGGRNFDEMRSLVTDALASETGSSYGPWVRDMDDESVAYNSGGDTLKRSYAVDDAGNVTFGEPAKVEIRTSYDPHPSTSGTAPAAAMPGTEADSRTFDDIRMLVQGALADALSVDASDEYPWVRDLTTEWVVYVFKGETFQRSYAIDDDGNVDLADDTAEVNVRTTYEPAAPDADDVSNATESGTVPEAVASRVLEALTVTEADRIAGRVIESKGSDLAGGRVFRVQIIDYGDSRNGRRYLESVMRTAAPKYEGAKAYDHHRSPDELATSTISGLVGHYRHVEASTTGLEADLHLLPSAIHTAEALDTSLANQAEGLPPLVGVSHDVMARYRPVLAGDKRLMEATEICSVNSADVVADPAAGGRPTRMVAGGIDDTSPEEDSMTLTELIKLTEGATPDQRAKLAEGLGIDPAKLAELRRTEGAPPPTPPPASVPDTWARESFIGSTVVRAALEARKLPPELASTVIEGMPERFSEADVAHSLEGILKLSEGLERAGLAPRIAHVEVTKDETDKKIERLNKTFDGDYQGGYRSFKEAYMDFTGARPVDFLAEDFNRRILRESIGTSPYDGAMRAMESVTAATWNTVLGDSITRRMVAEYSQPNLATWRRIVSSVVPINDFRTQRIERLGGYGVLPGVAEGAPYQSLTTPGNEEVTYSINKKGGTEDLTLETIANDDLRAVVRIPTKLGLAAAQTLYRFVWDLLNTNPTVYDGVSLFAVGHNNTATNALGRSGVDAARKAMRTQTAYGDSYDVLSIVPRILVVNSSLENIGYELTASAVAIPTSAPDGGASNIPNLHQGMDLVVVDYWSSATTWFLVADPALVPTIEIGFYRGQQDPELFVQNDPTVGSVFTSDKITWKIRHIYSGAPLDYRAFQRGNV